MSERKERMGHGHGPMGGMGMGGEKAKDFKGSFVKLLLYFKSYALPMTFVLLFAIASTIFMIVSPKILGRATDTIVDGFVKQNVYNKVISELPAGTVLPEGSTGEKLMENMPAQATEQLTQKQIDSFKKMDFSQKPHMDFTAIGEILLFLMGLYLLSSSFSYMQNFLMTGISQKITYQLRRNLSEKMDRLPLRYFDTKTHGEILSRVTNDIDAVSANLASGLTQVITSITSIVGILIMMFSINWLMTLVSLIVLPISLLLISTVVKHSQKYFKAQQDQLGNINGHIEEMYSGHVIVKAFNGEQRSIDTFEGINDQLCESAWKSQFFSGTMMPVMSFVGNIGYVAVCIIGGWLAIKNAITIGNIQSFIQYVRQFNQPIQQVANIANVFQSTVAASERVFEFLEEEEEGSESSKPVDLTHVQGGVRFEDVCFGYHADNTIIHHFNCTVKPGQKVAIVGPTGAGKTTIVKLLMRFYDINSGNIYIDGVNIKDYDRTELRRIFSMVLQDTWLYNGTIRDNIGYGKLGASDEEIYKAAKAAKVHHFIRTLPNGYDMVLNEEASNVSQGQKQLLTIARAVLADSPILILDEATSSVDTRTEVLIQKAMENLMAQRTSFVIAHRLSTIKDSDVILAMKDGDIVEIGNHEELMAKNGFYASLYNSQFEGKQVSA